MQIALDLHLQNIEIVKYLIRGQKTRPHAYRTPAIGLVRYMARHYNSWCWLASVYYSIANFHKIKICQKSKLYLLAQKWCSIYVKIINFIYQSQFFMTKLVPEEYFKNWTNRPWDMVKLPKISWNFDLLTHKIMLKMGQNCKLLVSILIFHGLLLPCKKN